MAISIAPFNWSDQGSFGRVMEQVAEGRRTEAILDARRDAQQSRSLHHGMDALGRGLSGLGDVLGEDKRREKKERSALARAKGMTSKELKEFEAISSMGIPTEDAVPQGVAARLKLMQQQAGIQQMEQQRQQRIDTLFQMADTPGALPEHSRMAVGKYRHNIDQLLGDKALRPGQQHQLIREQQDEMLSSIKPPPPPKSPLERMQESAVPLEKLGLPLDKPFMYFDQKGQPKIHEPRSKGKESMSIDERRSAFIQDYAMDAIAVTVKEKGSITPDAVDSLGDAADRLFMRSISGSVEQNIQNAQQQQEASRKSRVQQINTRLQQIKAELSALAASGDLEGDIVQNPLYAEAEQLVAELSQIMRPEEAPPPPPPVEMYPEGSGYFEPSLDRPGG